MNLDALTERFHISKQWLISQFKKYTNSTPMEYLCTMRIQQWKNCFDITVKNSSNAAVNGTLKYTVTCGSAVKSGEKSVLASSGNTAVKIADSLDKYGIYTI